MERSVDNLCVDRQIMLTWSPPVLLADKASHGHMMTSFGEEVEKLNIFTSEEGGGGSDKIYYRLSGSDIICLCLIDPDG